MKNILLLLFLFFAAGLSAQSTKTKKGHTVGVHLFYNDFSTAHLIHTTSLKNVLSNHLNTHISNMSQGIGLSYLKGITSRLDAVVTADGSYINYLFQNGTYYGSNKLLLALQAAANIKAFADDKPVVPYLTAGAGFSTYAGNSGFYIPAGLGLQFNFFKETFVFTNAQYRFALTSKVNHHLNYSIGIASNLFPCKKTAITPPVPPAPLKVLPPVTEEKPIMKNIVVQVADEATGQPLPYVSVTLNAQDGKSYTGSTDAAGKVVFNTMLSGAYTVSGILNNINTNTQSITKSSFATEHNDVVVKLLHNDPRFTLTGKVINKATQQPEGGVTVAVSNTTLSSISNVTSKNGDGTFMVQLEPNSNFTVVGKKSSYLSNIEPASTMGLNRSTTLYLKLELDVQEVTAGKNIVLNNINFSTGKSEVDAANSSDLNRLVQFLKDNPLLKLEIQGHTDNVGSAAKNKLLSQKRASSVVAYLVQNGIEPERLIAQGYGASKPVAVNTTEEGRAKNRRVEMRLIQ